MVPGTTVIYPSSPPTTPKIPLDDLHMSQEARIYGGGELFLCRDVYPTHLLLTAGGVGLSYVHTL